MARPVRTFWRSLPSWSSAFALLGGIADPGELFPWERLAESGFGLWPEPSVPVAGVPELSGALRRPVFFTGYNPPTREARWARWRSREAKRR